MVSYAVSRGKGTLISYGTVPIQYLKDMMKMDFPPYMGFFWVVGAIDGTGE